jgi:hypothetical protein
MYVNIRLAFSKTQRFENWNHFRHGAKREEVFLLGWALRTS